MAAQQQRIVIVGGSAAGQSAAEALVERGHRGPVTLITAEDRAPYQRTKVSKSFAAGFARDAFALVEPGWYERHRIELLVGRTVAAIDRAGHRIELDDGARLAWERLVLATGAEPRRLPLPDDVAGLVHHAHDVTQIEAIAAHARRAETALVVGMGVLGAEVAEQLARLGKRVTLAGDSSAVMQGELNEPAAKMLRETFVDNGVELAFDDRVCSIARAGAEQLRVELAAAGSRSFDMVVCCIGTQLRTELARAAGLRVETGVVVDHQLRTSDPEILAAGDVAQHSGGRLTHLWRHALHQGAVAGANAAGADERYRLEPFRLKCKLFDRYFFSLGRPAPADEASYEVVEERSDDGGRYRCCYYREGRVAGIVMCNDEPRQKLYNQAVVERWERARVEAIGGW